MAQFDVYRLTGLKGLGVDIQHDHLGQLPTRLIVPLLTPEDFAGGMARLNPNIRFDGTDLVLKAEFATAVNVRELGQPLGNIAAERDSIIAAMDMLVTGI
jgi:toxin CcdB